MNDVFINVYGVRLTTYNYNVQLNYTCFGETLQIRCSSNKWIDIMQVMFGRQNGLCGYCDQAIEKCI